MFKPDKPSHDPHARWRPPAAGVVEAAASNLEVRPGLVDGKIPESELPGANVLKVDDQPGLAKEKIKASARTRIWSKIRNFFKAKEREKQTFYIEEEEEHKKLQEEPLLTFAELVKELDLQGKLEEALRLPLKMLMMLALIGAIGISSQILVDYWDDFLRVGVEISTEMSAGLVELGRDVLPQVSWPLQAVGMNEYGEFLDQGRGGVVEALNYFGIEARQITETSVVAGQLLVFPNGIPEDTVIEFNAIIPNEGTLGREGRLEAYESHLKGLGVTRTRGIHGQEVVVLIPEADGSIKFSSPVNVAQFALVPDYVGDPINN